MEPRLETENKNKNKKWYMRGLRDGIPIGLGYFAVGFTLGITAREAGITAFQMGLMSLMMHASAGQFAVITIIAGQSGYVAMILTQLVINIRYLLMSCALSQKISPDTSMPKRMLMAYFVTDEIFGISVAQKTPISPVYNIGAMSVACPGWVLGTALGGIMGEILPSVVTSSLSIALYAMFLAIIIPPARENKVVAVLVFLSALLSFLFTKLNFLSGISTGMKVIILTVTLSALAAFFFPIEEDNNLEEEVE